MEAQILNLPNTKQCSKCKEYKELSYFGKDKGQRNGLRCACKDCSNALRMNYHYKNREESKSKSREFRLKNPNYTKEYGKKYRVKNRERIRKWEKEYYYKNIEKEREKKRRNYAKNIDKIKVNREKWKSVADYDKSRHAIIMCYNIKKNAKLRKIEFNLLPSDIIIPEFCPVLGLKLVRGNKLNGASIDRIDNTKGYTKYNIIVVCRLANMIKTCAHPEQIISVGNFYKRLEESRQ